MKKPTMHLVTCAFALTLSGLIFAAEETGEELPGRGVTGTTLEEFFTAAIDYSPRLNIAAESLNVGSARRRQTNGQLLPQVRANASLSDNRQNNALGQQSNYDGQRYSVQLTQVLFNWQAFAARGAAYLLEDQLEAEYYGELATLLADVAERYFNVLQAQDALDSIASELDAVNNQLEQIQSLYDRQLTRITDLYQAQASVAAVEAEQLRLQTDLAMVREGLYSVSGLEPGELYQLREDTLVPPLENSMNFWVNLAEQQNHQIRAREFAVQAAEKRIAERKGAYMPQVSLVLQRQDSDVGYDNVPISRTDNTYLGLDVSIPLYAGGSNRARVSEARSQRRIAESELRQVELEAGERVRAAYLRVQSSQTLVEAAEKLVESTTLSSQAMQRGFELGAVTSVDVLDALRDEFRAQRDLQKARYEQVKYLLILKRDTGTLTADDLLEVGTWLEAPQL